MLRFLFPRLTPVGAEGAALFNAVTAEARARHWYVEGAVPDTLDGRFAVLATVAALAMVRLERAGDDASTLAVSLTERFAQVMESEHRELGLGDPKLGRTVRKLVGALSRRVDLWRAAVAGASWAEAAIDSVYGANAPAADALAHTAASLRRLWSRLEGAGVAALAEGRLE
jgi:cytochrome b pre-mRNA-processing protein 3